MNRFALNVILKMFNYYSTKLTVSSESLIKNLEFFKSRISKKMQILAIIKANAYGYGDIQIAKILIENGINYFAVADFEEGVNLRKNGIKCPIMVLYPGKNNLSIILENCLEPTIYNEQMLDEIIEISKSKIKIHIKFDTGMNRYGIKENELQSIVDKIKKEKNIILGSIFSHMSSNKMEHQNFSINQMSCFNRIKSSVTNNFDYKIDTHILSSFGIPNFPNCPDSIVRIGFGLYNGILNNPLDQIGELSTQIAQIKNINRGDSVGYNLGFTATKKMKIAVLPIGYADGLQRSWGNGKLRFLYDKILVPVVGQISMDSCIVDITEVEKSKEGDNVILFGKNRSIFDLSKELETIPYEITAGLSKRIHRVFT